MDEEVHNVERYISALEENFDTVHVLHFEDMVKNMDSFANELFEILGCNPVRFENEVKNPSFSSSQIEVLRKLNHIWKGKIGDHLCKAFWKKILYSIAKR